MKTVPRQPLSKAASADSLPVVYCPVKFSKWRWSEPDSPRSALRSSQFWAGEPNTPAAGVRVVDRFGIGVLQLGGEAVVQTAAQLQAAPLRAWNSRSRFRRCKPDGHEAHGLVTPIG